MHKPSSKVLHFTFYVYRQSIHDGERIHRIAMRAGRREEDCSRTYHQSGGEFARRKFVLRHLQQGQYKSMLVCPVCDKISITFDPVMYLSLPLPSTATGDGSSLPMPLTVKVLKQGCCEDLNQALGIACCLHNDEYFLLAEVYEHRIYRYLENPSESLATIKDDEHVVAYRLSKGEPDLIRLEICHRYHDNERKLFLTPLVTILKDPQSGIDIDLSVKRLLSPLRRKKFVTSSLIDHERDFCQCKRTAYVYDLFCHNLDI